MMRDTPRPIKLAAACLAALLILPLLLAQAPPALAQSQVTLSETTLAMRGLLTDSLQRTFGLTVQGEAIQNVTVVRHDLLDAQAGTALLSDKIAVSPEALARASGHSQFTVTVSGATTAGHYTGPLEIRYDGQPVDAPLIVTLDVTLEAAPSVDVDVNAKNLTLFVQPPLWDLPYAGRPSGAAGQPAAAAALPALAEVAVYLVQSGAEEAVVEEAQVLTLRGSAGQTLPAGAVSVSAALPMTLAGNAAGPLRLVVAGDNLEAGEYGGTLLVRVRNQAAPIQVPVTVKIKHGPLLPLLVLAAGLLVAGFLGWWNNQGKLRRDTVRPIERLAEDIRNKRKKLQAEERDHAIGLLREAWTAINAGEPADEITKKFQKAEAYVTEREQALDKLLKEKLEVLLNQARAVVCCRALREAQAARLEAVQQRLNNGDYRRLEEAARTLEEERRKVDALVKVDAGFAKLPADKQEEVAGDLDKAGTLVDARAILVEAGVKTEDLPSLAGVSFGKTAEPPIAQSQDFELNVTQRLQLEGAGLLVTAILYLFALAVGWVSLYAGSATFGADPQSYISLFLWGAVVETVRGQTISLTSLETAFTSKAAPPTQ
jgi:hypothetical protein